jgi:hypothetical protein
MIVKEKFIITQKNLPFSSMTQEQLDEVNNLCKKGKEYYLFSRNYGKSNHEYALSLGQRKCQ